MSRGNTAELLFSITLMDNVAKDLSCLKSTYSIADMTVIIHLPLPPLLGTTINPGNDATANQQRLETVERGWWTGRWPLATGITQQ